MTEIALLFCGIASTGFAATGFAAKEELYKLAPFSDYQPILDRMPFGPMPSGLNPDGTVAGAAEGEQAMTPAEVQAERQQLARQVKISCVNISPDGETLIGFTDLSEKPQKNYYIAVGESSDGWSIEDADYDEEWARLKKDGVEITVQLGKGLVDPSQVKGGGASRHTVASVPQPSHNVQATPVPSQIQPPTVQRLRGRSLRDRLFSRSKLGRGLLRPNSSGLSAAATPQAASPKQSFTERLKERKRQQTAAQAAKEKATQERLLKMAREAAAAELTRQKEKEAEARAAEEEYQQE